MFTVVLARYILNAPYSVEWKEVNGILMAVFIARLSTHKLGVERRTRYPYYHAFRLNVSRIVASHPSTHPVKGRIHHLSNSEMKETAPEYSETHVALSALSR